MNASQQKGGPLAKFSQGPPDTHNWGGGDPSKIDGAPPRSSKRTPMPPYRLNEHPSGPPAQPALPPHLHASQQRRGPLAKFPQGPPDTHNWGGGTPSKIGSAQTQYSERPSKPSARLSECIPRPPDQLPPPSYSRLTAEGGTPGKILAPPPPDTHNPGGAPLTNFAGHQAAASAHPGQLPPLTPPDWYTAQQRGEPSANFELPPLAASGGTTTRGQAT